MATDGLTSTQRVEVLRASQQALAAALAVCEPGQVAALVRELRAVAGELESLGVGKSDDPVDQVAQRRAERLRKAKDGGA